MYPIPQRRRPPPPPPTSVWSPPKLVVPLPLKLMSPPGLMSVLVCLELSNCLEPFWKVGFDPAALLFRSPSTLLTKSRPGLMPPSFVMETFPGLALARAMLSCENFWKKWDVASVQRWDLIFVGGLVKFLPALASLFSLALPGSCLTRFAKNKSHLCTVDNISDEHTTRARGDRPYFVLYLLIISAEPITTTL